MNANDVKSRLSALREKVNTALRAADTSMLHSVPDDIEAIINLVDGKSAPTHQDGSPWTPGDDTLDGSYHPAKVGGDPTIDTDVPSKPTTPQGKDVQAPNDGELDANGILHGTDGKTTTSTPEHAAPHLSGDKGRGKVDDKRVKA